MDNKRPNGTLRAVLVAVVMHAVPYAIPIGDELPFLFNPCLGILGNLRGAAFTRHVKP
jgi:hypothetical protein